MDGLNPAEPQAGRARPSPPPDIQTLFKRHFGYTPVHVVRAPARLGLLGDYTESQEGLAISVAVNRYVEMAAGPRSDGKIELLAGGRALTERFWMSETKRNPATSWADPVKAILQSLRHRGVNFSGFNAAFQDRAGPCTARARAGALGVATVLTLRRLYPFSLTEAGATIPPSRNAKGELPPLAAAERIHFARFCHAAASRFLDHPPGLLDAIGSLCARPWHATCIDLRFLTVEPAPLIGEVIVVCDAAPTESPDRLTSSLAGALAFEQEINDSCSTVARRLRAKSLRSVELKFLRSNQALFTPNEYEHAYWVAGEIARVVAAERALLADDHRQMGQYLFQSHEHLRALRHQDSPELDLLVELARAHPGCLGARSAGEPSVPRTINLVAHHQADNFMQHMARSFATKTGRPLTCHVCQAVDGAA